MANKTIKTDRKILIVVDTAPPVGGYYTHIVNANDKKVNNLFFAIRDLGETAFSARITLQWRQKGEDDTWEAWQIWDTYSSIQRKFVDDHSAEVQWRAGIEENDYISGTISVGFNW